ncbi:hypothetical protein [Undibacterium sp.]|uniref:hypothetical protein n=1 Tax=Undibacterium sp. TaxID=1914977 RepID=UPI003753CDA1
MSNLVKYNAARYALSEAVKIDEVKDMRDKAEAMAAYARQAKDTEMVEWATEIKVRAERKAGQMLAEMEKNKGAATRSHDSTALPKTLSELDISKNESSRWQKLATVNDTQFEEAIAAAKEVAGQVTTAAMLRAAKNNENPVATPKPEEFKKPSPVVNPEPNVMPGDDDEFPSDDLDFVQMADDLQKQRDEYKAKLDRYENTDVQKVIADFDGLHNRLLCETAEKNEWIKKYNFQSELLKKIRSFVGAESNSEILTKLGKS